MRKLCFVSRTTVALGVCFLLIECHPLRAQAPSLPDSLRESLARYADLDPLAVTWSESIEAASTGRTKMPPVMLGNFIRSSRIVQLLAFCEGRIYMHRAPKGESSASPIEISFDRSVLYSGNRGRTLQKWLSKNDLPEGNYFSYRYFQAAGIRLPTLNRELILSWHPQSELLALLAEGGRVDTTGSANLDGRPLILVQVSAKDRSLQGHPVDLSGMETHLRMKRGITEEEVQRQLRAARKLQERRAPLRRYDFYFDPERGHAVRRLETRDEAGHLLTRSDCNEHEQLVGRIVWLPRRCQVEEYTFNELQDEETGLPHVFGSPLYVAQFRVSAFDVKPWPNERFELKDTTPGTRVNDATFPEVEGKNGVAYTIPANPQQLDEVIAAARARHQARVNAGKWTPTIKTLLLIVNGVGLPILVFYLIVRRRKKASGA